VEYVGYKQGTFVFPRALIAKVISKLVSPYLCYSLTTFERLDHIVHIFMRYILHQYVSSYRFDMSVCIMHDCVNY